MPCYCENIYPPCQDGRCPNAPEALGELVPCDPRYVQVEQWRDILVDGKETGRIRLVGTLPLIQIYEDLKRRLEAEESDTFYWEWISMGWFHRDKPKIEKWPEPQNLRSVACYVTRGGSEGYHAHVDLLYKADSQSEHLEVQKLANIKVLGSKDVAWAIARRCADLLDV